MFTWPWFAQFAQFAVLVLGAMWLTHSMQRTFIFSLLMRGRWPGETCSQIPNGGLFCDSQTQATRTVPAQPLETLPVIGVHGRTGVQ